MQHRSLRSLVSLATTAGLLVFGQVASAEEYGEDFYRNNPVGAAAPANLKTPVELTKTRQFRGVVIDSNLSTRRILVREGKNQVHWLTIPASSQPLNGLTSGDQVLVKMAGFKAIDISAG